jgi:hypothetical protein
LPPTQSHFFCMGNLQHHHTVRYSAAAVGQDDSSGKSHRRPAVGGRAVFRGRLLPTRNLRISAGRCCCSPPGRSTQAGRWWTCARIGPVLRH